MTDLITCYDHLEPGSVLYIISYVCSRIHCNLFINKCSLLTCSTYVNKKIMLRIEDVTSDACYAALCANNLIRMSPSGRTNNGWNEFHLLPTSR